MISILSFSTAKYNAVLYKLNKFYLKQILCIISLIKVIDNFIKINLVYKTFLLNKR